LTFDKELPELVNHLTDVEIKTEDFKKSLEGLSGAELLKLTSAINDEVAPSLTVWSDSTELVLQKQLALQEALASNSDITEANTGVVEQAAIRGGLASDFATENILGNLTKVEQKNLDLNAGEEKYAKMEKERKDKQLKDDLRNAALSGQSASESMKSVVRAQAMEAAAGAISSIMRTLPFPLSLVAAAGAGGLVSGIIDKALGSIPSFATGGDFVTSGEQLIRVGDNPSGRERVQVTPLDAGGEPTGGGGSVVVNVSGNVMSSDYTEEILIPHISDAIRRGASLGAS